MPGPHVDALIAKYAAEDAGADPAIESPSAPPAGDSVAGSAPADETTIPKANTGNGAPADDGSTSPGAPTSAPKLDHDELRAKLDADRKRQQAKELRRKAKEHESATSKAKTEAEEILAKAKTLGKDQKWIDFIRSTGRDPREVFREMQEEALKAGTPDAKIDTLAKQLEEERNARLKLEKDIADEKAAAEEARKKAESEKAARAEAQEFQSEFFEHAKETKYSSLVEEYEAPELFAIANDLKNKPDVLFAYAKKLNVALTRRDGHFTMTDIFNVMHASQASYRAKMQRRTQSAASQTSETPEQGSAAKPTVNGTAARKAESTTIGHDLTTSRASEQEKLKAMSKDERTEYLKKKYADAR